ncbi:sulfur carrier protein ThiS [Clostridium botulinum]|uniref:Thiamine biosynthesis protein ThiS n=1 Tax=Clostridium botulinum C/D str. DC5 TaxID=1443128 RepID=A0A0A0IEW1_CLOBO|nr:sulfur carrier protein ThiS [Clostridium botulinum]KEI01301.1 thiamine biosynthesis protein ThiS [Clostridium botulinum C/D str. BKT75002]KEI13083.1 thiamine biosynthesis protein ThiS [Clostridium botulinum C/D str. BKT2873]KGM95650.1 thiamine biosynthesis protein ThiS [Clostridium botulinum D str. CCUG 7971]KGM99999.1 thiamine biosynthesis protein ThiS [Clostridium botulinum C/D str. DC5]KOC46866.1 thiamine biosynthesis protein ThiS [Clostridium botulinum]
MIVNGEKMSFEYDMTVEELLNKLKLNSSKVVVEVDMDIIPKQQYSIKKMSSNSKVEIIQFVGGG